MNHKIECITEKSQNRMGWLNGGKPKDSYFMEKHKLLMLKRSFKEKIFPPGKGATIKEQKE